jgi:hypothetical protein
MNTYELIKNNEKKKLANKIALSLSGVSQLTSLKPNCFSNTLSTPQ